MLNLKEESLPFNPVQKEFIEILAFSEIKSYLLIPTFSYIYLEAKYWNGFPYHPFHFLFLIIKDPRARCILSILTCFLSQSS